MEAIVALLTDPNSVAHIALVYSAIVTIGLALGRVKVYGISLGVIVVMFVGLVFAHFGVKINPEVLNFTRDFGLILFIFFVGLQVGPSFFSSFKSVGVALNSLMFLTVLIGIAITIGLFFVFGDQVSLPQVLGVHYGAITCTPGLGATKEALEELHYHGEDIAIAYACAYPLGLVTIIGVAILLRALFKINLEEEDKHWETEEKEHNREPIFFHVEVTNPAVAGKTLGAIREFTGRSFICSRILSKGELSSPTAETVVQEGDVLRIVAAPEDRLPVTAFFGGEKQGVDLATEKSPLATRTILITREKFNGMTLKALALNQMDGVNITRVFRAGMTLFPYSNLHLQVGDQVYCVGPEPALQRLETLLGNKMKKLYHPNIFTIFVGLAFGIVLGSIPIAVPGMPAPLKLGFARLVTYTTQSASLMMREIGISLFLASVGLAAGESFVAAITQGNGLLYVLLGLFVTLIPLIVVGIVARKVYRINYHSIVGLMAGATTDPPALAYAATLSEKNSSSVAYSTVYPLAMFLRILTGQLLLVLLWGFIS